jgi:hypothetical protein
MYTTLLCTELIIARSYYESNQLYGTQYNV